jgi:hypothetical protein
MIFAVPGVNRQEVALGNFCESIRRDGKWWDGTNARYRRHALNPGQDLHLGRADPE